ncbi:MAG TPA: winged helix-turn-helix domain-containing protein [Pyrinomonadaceae bacterium]
MSEPKEHFYEFGPFRIDTVKRRLLREDEPVPLKPKAFETLLVLIEHSGQVMEKEELMKRLWPDSFVEEANLSVNISALRKALGESPQEHRYIVTIPGRGYCFVASVKESSEQDTELILSERTRSQIIIEEEEASVEGYRAQPDVSRDASVVATEGRKAPEAAAHLTASAGSLRPGHLDNKLHSYRNGMRLAVAVLIVGAIAVALLAYLITNRKGSSDAFRNVKLTRLTTTGRAINASISPDGKYIAYVIAEAGRQSLWIKQVATASSIQIIPAVNAHYTGLTFTNDGDFIYYVRSEQGPGVLYRIPVLGGTSIRLQEDVDSPVTFSPDGARMAFVRGYPDRNETSLIAANSDGTGEQKLVALKAPTSVFNVGVRPAWSPDEKSIACSVKNIDDKGEYQNVLEVQVGGGATRPLTSRRWQRVGRMAWVSGGKGLVMVASADEGSTLYRQIWYLALPEGAARKITNDLNDYEDLSLTADSRTLVTVQSDQQANLWIAPVQGTGPATQITSGNYDGLNGLSWTPQGEVVYTTRTLDNQDLWITSPQGNNQRQLTAGAGMNRQPSVTPDGRYVVYSSNRTGSEYIWRIDLDGSHPTQLTSGIGDHYPVCSPDGRWVVYRSYVFGPPNLWKVSIDGGEPVRLTYEISGRHDLSPQDGLIAFYYRKLALSPIELATLPLDGQEQQHPVNVPGFQYHPGPIHWTSDGRALTYIETRDGVSNIWSQTLDSGPAKQLTDFKTDEIFWFDWSRDGRWLVCARGAVTRDVIIISDLK